jgi:hypothetical protein
MNGLGVERKEYEAGVGSFGVIIAPARRCAKGRQPALNARGKPATIPPQSPPGQPVAAYVAPNDSPHSTSRDGHSRSGTIRPEGLEHDCGRGEPRMFWKRRTKAILAVMLAIVGLSGCVERRYTIRTDPPGALVIANGEEIGVTPVSKAYTYYGIRRFRILREGFETLDIDQPFEPPWYDNYLTEFFTENLIPYTFRDERTLTYKLSTEKQADKVPLTERAEALRAEAKVLPPPRRGGFLGFFGLD